MTVAQANLSDDSPQEIFDLHGSCGSCGYSATIARDRIPDGLSVQDLARRLRCTACGSRENGMRIIYTGASRFRHRAPALPWQSAEAIREASPAPGGQPSLTRILAEPDIPQLRSIDSEGVVHPTT
jgi:hypothetical protein